MRRYFNRLLIAAGLIVFALTAGAAVRSEAAGDFFMPHAHCYLFNRKLMLLHGWSDFLIGCSYVSISATLTYLVLKLRRELPFHWVMLAFALFIVACGATHFFELWTLQAAHPAYWLAGWVKAMTAVASLATAMVLPPLVPKVYALLQSARREVERKTELEKAYVELSELHKKALAAVAGANRASSAESVRAVSSTSPDRPLSLASMAKDVTLHARELERAKRDAENANRAKDQFLAILSHELRTPLTPALAAACSLESAEDIDHTELRTSLALIRRNIELEARLVDDLLDITRINKGKLEVHLTPTDLHATIRHAAEMCDTIGRAKHSHLSLTLELKAEQHFVSGDGPRLAQVFWNLILNAIKFTPPGGHITVATSNPNPETVRVEVSDTGIGIEAGLLSKIFEPFQQGHARSFGGVGLGLSIARGLLAAHEATIVASSEGTNCGATFIVEIPAITDTVAPARSPEPDTFARAGQPLRILLVEDHDDTRAVLSRLLTRWGHVVKTAASVAEAMRVSQAFDLQMLISDVGLPDGSGIDLVGPLTRDSKIPAIAMSGYGMESDLEHTRRAGFDIHLVKPVSADRLKEAIERLVENGMEPSSKEQ